MRESERKEKATLCTVTRTRKAVDSDLNNLQYRSVSNIVWVGEGQGLSHGRMKTQYYTHVTSKTNTVCAEEGERDH